MRPNQYSFAIMVIAFCAALIFGCSEKNQPVASDTTSTTLQSTTTTTTADLTSSFPGIDLSNTKGIISLNWHKMLHPESRTAEIRGDGMVVGFDSILQGGTKPRPGSEIGSVTLNYGSASVSLKKIIMADKGISYSTMSPPRFQSSGTNINFIANGEYQFQISGSTNFAALSGTVTAPSALIHITSQAAGDSVNMSNDLHVAWQGGTSGGSIVLNVSAIPPLGPNDGDSMHVGGPLTGDSLHHGGMPPGGGRGPGGIGHDGPPHGGPQNGGPPPGGMIGGGPGMPPVDSSRVIVMKLDNNPGMVTISAVQLQGILKNLTNAKLMIGVSQMNMKDVDHDGGKVHLILTNDDAVVVNTK